MIVVRYEGSGRECPICKINCHDFGIQDFPGIGHVCEDRRCQEIARLRIKEAELLRSLARDKRRAQRDAMKDSIIGNIMRKLCK